MNYIYSGGRFTIYEDDAAQSFSELPVGIYKVNFAPMEGWWLSSEQQISVDEKIYGDHNRKVQKVVSTFDKFPRNLGVLLSGGKGMGKSLVCKKICIEMMEKGYPVIIVNKYIPGISDFLHKIDTESVIFMDEFDKMFQHDNEFESEGPSPQDEMLSLFDGIDVNKKLFLVTCNDINKLSTYFINRPGRFHYHFRFSYPKDEEIEQYLKENVNKKYHKEIINVIAFSHKVRMNYDCLRSVAFELNLGYKFYDFIDDLNILHLKNERFAITLVDNEDNEFKGIFELDPLSENIQAINLYNGRNDYAIQFKFDDLDYDSETQAYIATDLNKIKVNDRMSEKENNVKIKSFSVKNEDTNTFSYFG